MLYRKKLNLYVIYIITIFLIMHILTAIFKEVNELLQSENPVIIYWPPEVNIQCYNQVTNDALISVEDPDFSPKYKSIFFHETSCRGGIDSRQACAVESAARANPDWEVYLLFTGPVTDIMLKRSCLVKLLQFPNIKLARIHVHSYSKHTAVSHIVNQKLNESMHAVQHSADIMKMLTLNKWGGVTLDLDMLVLRSFSKLTRNFIAKSSPTVLASGVMRFSRDKVGLNLTKSVLLEIAGTYQPKSWSFNGACAIERVLLSKCKDVLKNNGNCRGISIFSNKGFYPTRLTKALTLVMKEPEPVRRVFRNTYTYCFWNIRTDSFRVHQQSAYAKMAKKYCPTIYHSFGDEFGV